MLTVTFVYCFAKISQKELRGEEEGHLTYLWLIVMVLLFMLYGFYTWGDYPLKGCSVYAWARKRTLPRQHQSAAEGPPNRVDPLLISGRS